MGIPLLDAGAVCYTTTATARGFAGISEKPLPFAINAQLNPPLKLSFISRAPLTGHGQAQDLESVSRPIWGFGCILLTWAQ
jgi:hypothetical protein